ncbi:MAG: hypothetical protein K2L81_05325, partial [Muribaculaceae bacterium]|nr:hypothetical protein [Muribaculaceae bacterium]
MKSRLTTLLLALLCLFSNFATYAAKTVKIKLTGTTYENMKVIVGQTGRSEIITSLPYTLEVPKEDLPIRLKFQSESYLYYDIDVPKKPFDTTGHVYLVKINETAMSLRNSGGNTTSVADNKPFMGQTTEVGPIIGIDVQHGVNAAPITSNK